MTAPLHADGIERLLNDEEWLDVMCAVSEQFWSEDPEYKRRLIAGLKTVRAHVDAQARQIETLKAAAALPHLCRDGHVLIAHRDESEMCPLCRALAWIERLERNAAEVRR